MPRTLKPLNPSEPRPLPDHHEADRLFDSIDCSDVSGLRDRALMSLIFYNHLRLSDALGMERRNMFWKRQQPYLRIFGSKALPKRRDREDEVILPCLPEAERALTGYIGKSNLTSDLEGPLLRTVDRGTGKVTRKPLSAKAAHLAINRRARQAGFEREISLHELRIAGARLLKEQAKTFNQSHFEELRRRFSRGGYSWSSVRGGFRKAFAFPKSTAYFRMNGDQHKMPSQSTARLKKLIKSQVPVDGC